MYIYILCDFNFFLNFFHDDPVIVFSLAIFSEIDCKTEAGNKCFNVNDFFLIVYILSEFFKFFIK